MSFSGLGGLRASSLEAPGLHDTKELLRHKKVANQNDGVFFFKRVLNFMRNPKLAHILVKLCAFSGMSSSPCLEPVLLYRHGGGVSGAG